MNISFFLFQRSLRPVIVENLEEPDEFDGYPEKNIPKKHPEFLRAREVLIILSMVKLVKF